VSAAVGAERIHGLGEMASRIREYGWGASALGAIGGWSPELQSTVNLMLSLPNPAWVCWGEDLTFLYNDAYAPRLEGRHPDALGCRFPAVWPEAWAVAGPKMEACLREGRSFQEESILVPILMHGRLVDQYWSHAQSPVFEDGEIAGVINISQNVTDQVLLNRQRDAVADRLSHVLRATSDGVVYVDREWRITYLNDSAKQILSAVGDAAGRDLWEMYPVAVYEGSPYVEHYFRAMDERLAGEFEAYYPAPLRLWLHISVKPAEEGIVIFFRDVSEERRKTDALRQSQMRMRAIYSTSQAYMGMLSVEGTILECNRAALGFADSRPEDVIGLRFWQGPWFASTPGMPERVREAVRRAAAGECVRMEMPLIRPGDGTTLTFDFSLSPVRNEAGEITYLVPEGHDISPLKTAQSVILQTEKLAAVGRLASSIAHEINNPLESVTNLLYLAARSATPGETQEYIAVAERELLRVSAIANQTLRFHKQSSKPKAVLCDELIDGVLAIHQGRIVSTRVMVERRRPETRPVTCMDGEVRQVLANLIGNAIDAMGARGGRLLIRTGDATDWRTGRQGLKVTVADTGSGMSETTQKKAFEPFYTTKGFGGTGLGLWISHEIVGRHKGRLKVKSNQREGSSGTVFTMFLPVSIESVAA
jgi:PAS domain S-box-containing protein